MYVCVRVCLYMYEDLILPQYHCKFHVDQLILNRATKWTKQVLLHADLVNMSKDKGHRKLNDVSL